MEFSNPALYSEACRLANCAFVKTVSGEGDSAETLNENVVVNTTVVVIAVINF